MTEKSILELRIEGLDCADEAEILRRALKTLEIGEESIGIDILQAKLTVVLGNHSSDDVVTAIDKSGLKAHLWEEGSQGGDHVGLSKWRTGSTLVCGSFTALGFLLHAMEAGGASSALGGAEEGGGPSFLSCLSYSIAILAGGSMVAPKAWVAARNLRPDMNLLMTVAVVGAVSIGEWFEAAMVTFLFAISLWLEKWSVGRAQKAIGSLMDMTPARARVVGEDGELRKVEVDTVQVGTKFTVLPGEKIALDGVIQGGRSEVDQAPITGESKPVKKEPGDDVFAGTLNGDGALDVLSTKLASNTTIANIAKLVSAARSSRSPSERWVDRFAQIYTPIVLLLALLTFLLPPMLGSSWGVWFYRSLVLLVIACPCALVISTPVTIVASLARAARRGVLIKGGEHIETPARLRAIAFDKTGTLTKGDVQVSQVIPLDGHDVEGILGRAAGLESRSDHPLARAIVSYGRELGVEPLPASKVVAIKGKGLRGEVDGRMFWLGSHRYLEERDQETAEVHEKLEELSAAGQSVVVLGDDNHVCGFIALGDAIRPEAKEVTQRLRADGIDRLVMLTGDNHGTAKAIGGQLDLHEIHGEMLPEEKIAKVAELEGEFSPVAMVGDGVNDAPALARASLGIAMGAAGSDVAIETADIALMSDDITAIPWLIEHSRHTLRIVRQNVVFALGLKILVFLLALIGIASLWMAILADAGASLLVIANGLRILRSPGGMPPHMDRG